MAPGPPARAQSGPMLSIIGLLAIAVDTDDPLVHGKTALNKGLHHKAFDHFKTAHRARGQAAWDHGELQDGLCVCAAKLKKEKVAVSACLNSTALRPGDKAPHSLLMARGEASLMGERPDAHAAWRHFRVAVHVAARGEALRHEREAREALRRSESRLYASFAKVKGVLASAERVGGSSVVGAVEALAGCVAQPDCRAVQLPAVAKKGARVEAGFFRSTSTSSDDRKKATERKVAYVRDAACRYRALPRALMRAHAYKRLVPNGAAQGESMSVQRAMHICDANSATCAGFVVEAAPADAEDHGPDGAPAPHGLYRVEFRSAERGALPPAEAATAPASDLSDASTRWTSFVRTEPAPPKPKTPPKPPPGTPGDRGRTSFRMDGRGGGGGPFGGGGGFPGGGFPGGGFPGGGRGGRGGGRGPAQPKAAPRRDYYGILGVKRDASAREIRKAYHKMAMKWCVRASSLATQRPTRARSPRWRCASWRGAGRAVGGRPRLGRAFPSSKPPHSAVVTGPSCRPAGTPTRTARPGRRSASRKPSATSS